MVHDPQDQPSSSILKIYPQSSLFIEATLLFSVKTFTIYHFYHPVKCSQ